MKILRLAQARVLLWARREDGCEAFEVSKVVSQPLQPRCPTAPRCPSEAGAFEATRPAWIDPTEPPAAECAYAFTVRGECLRHRNQLALQSALFKPNEIQMTRRLLEALGYDVTEEYIDPSQCGTRILKAHGYISASHQARLLHSPSAGPIVLVREVAAEATPARRRSRPAVRPIGGHL